MQHQVSSLLLFAQNKTLGTGVLTAAPVSSAAGAAGASARCARHVVIQRELPGGRCSARFLHLLRRHHSTLPVSLWACPHTRPASKCQSSRKTSNLWSEEKSVTLILNRRNYEGSRLEDWRTTLKVIQLFAAQEFCRNPQLPNIAALREINGFGTVAAVVCLFLQNPMILVFIPH